MDLKTKKAVENRKMFSRIADKYDLMNRIITFGRDKAWLNYTIKKVGPPEKGRLLDVGTGTGNIAVKAALTRSSLFVVGTDFSIEMMQKGKTGAPQNIYWCNSDALNLPFKDKTFDAVTSGYVIRNVIDINKAFQEQFRILKQGGKVVCLETSRPSRNLIYPFVLFYFRFVIPFLGALITGHRQAYSYLPNSTLKFKRANKISEIMRKAGFQKVEFRHFMFGTIAVHSGTK